MRFHKVHYPDLMVVSLQSGYLPTFSTLGRRSLFEVTPEALQITLQVWFRSSDLGSAGADHILQYDTYPMPKISQYSKDPGIIVD